MDDTKKNSQLKYLVDKYKYLLQNSQVNERFKWEAINEFQKNWNPEANDFYQMLDKAFKGRKYLFYQFSWNFISNAAKQFPEQVKSMFEQLYNESNDLTKRMINFQNSATQLLPDIKQKLRKEKYSHQQDERTLSVYLTLRFPDRYYFFKDSYYQQYCSLINATPEKRIVKYLHFNLLADELKNNAILQDKELFELHRKQFPDVGWDDSNVLTQSILYTTLDLYKDTPYPPNKEQLNYWIFQGNPDQYDAVMALRDGVLDSWTVKAHKNEIKPGDRVILWLTGDEAGCYALATVESPVKIIEDSTDRHYWLTSPPVKPYEEVELRVDINAWSTPLLKDEIIDLEVFKNFKAGNQGTNLTATQAEFETIKRLLSEKEPIDRHFWLYAPGDKALYWDEFYQNGIMAIGWKELGNLAHFQNKAQIVSKLQEIEKTTSSKKNDATACYEFTYLLKPGDVIIAKKGRSDYLGYGIVSGDFYYDPSHKMPNQRKIEWKKKGKWPEDGKIVLKTLTDITKYPDYVKKLIEMIGIEIDSEKIPSHPLNTILYGPPGTGKTYSTINHALSIIEEKSLDDIKNENRVEVKKRFDDYVNQGQIEFVTFHQSMSYEDFIEGIKPGLGNEQTIDYDIESGLFKNIATKAIENWHGSKMGTRNQLPFEDAFAKLVDEWENDPDMKFPLKTVGKDFTVLGFTKTSIKFRKASGGTNHTLSISTLREYYYEHKEVRQSGLGIYYPGLLNRLKSYLYDIKDERTEKRFVLIVDEINRGNVAQIFGELITLIEEDKRIGQPEALEVTLPYSKEKFGVPPNLYLIGTMNTADRSVEALDTALRRRFSFVEMMPQYDFPELEFEPVPGISLSNLLKRINIRLEKLLDKDHMIGHSYFLNIKSVEELKLVFYNKIIPLLQEYFYGDPGKIALVLGNEFFDVPDVKNREAVLAKISWYDAADDLEERFIVHIRDVMNMTDPEFITAIETLMNKPQNVAENQ